MLILWNTVYRNFLKSFIEKADLCKKIVSSMTLQSDVVIKKN